MSFGEGLQEVASEPPPLPTPQPTPMAVHSSHCAIELQPALAGRPQPFPPFLPSFLPGTPLPNTRAKCGLHFIFGCGVHGGPGEAGAEVGQGRESEIEQEGRMLL